MTDFQTERAVQCWHMMLIPSSYLSIARSRSRKGECLSEGTRAALAEFDAMKEYPERYRRCRSFDEMLQDVLAGK